MSFSFAILPTGHLLGIEGLEPPHINALLDLAESYALLNRQGKTVLYVTHDPLLAARAHRVVTIRDGLVVRE